MDTALDVTTAADGTLVIAPHGDAGADGTVELRQTLVHAVRRTRPLRLEVELADVGTIDSINIGTPRRSLPPSPPTCTMSRSFTQIPPGRSRRC